MTILLFQLLVGIVWLVYRRKAVPSDYKNIETPYPKLLLYGAAIPSINLQVKRRFCHIMDAPEIEGSLREILGHDHELTWQELRSAVWTAEFYLFKPKHPGRVFAWAQVKGEKSNKLVLGFESFLLRAGLLRNGAIFHELCHCAQEIREGSLTREWSGQATKRQWVRLELEAHLYALIWPLLTGMLIALDWMLIQQISR